MCFASAGCIEMQLNICSIALQLQQMQNQKLHYSIDAAVLGMHQRLQFHSCEAFVLVVKTWEVMRRRIYESTDAGECRRKWMQGITGWGIGATSTLKH